MATILKVYTRLSEAGMSSDVIRLEDCFTNDNPFLGLGNQYQQKKYFITNFNLIVSISIWNEYLLYFEMQEPTPVVLGERHKWKGNGIKRRYILKQDQVYYVPILETFQSLLNNHVLLSEVTTYKCILIIINQFVFNFYV